MITEKWKLKSESGNKHSTCENVKTKQNRERQERRKWKSESGNKRSSCENETK